jgi:large subunit ribosomal protein L15
MSMRLNTLQPAEGSKRDRRRIGRGAGSGWGKTSGRGQKGQKARAGGGVRPGFEGGQQPLKQRVPKFGFRSRIGQVTAEVRLGEIGKVDGDVVDLDTLKAANVVARNILRARVMLSGSIDRAVTVKGLGVTRGARAAIEAAGGKVEG